MKGEKFLVFGKYLQKIEILAKISKNHELNPLDRDQKSKNVVDLFQTTYAWIRVPSK